MFKESLDAYLADWGVPATWVGVGRETARVLYDAPDGEILSRRVTSRGYKITFPANRFAGIARADAITVKARAFTVQQVNAVDDGAFLEAELESVS